MMRMADHVAIGVEILRIDSGCSLEKEFIELIRRNSSMLLYLTVNQVDSCYDCICDPLTSCQRHLVDTRSCFDYDLRIPSHMISKISYIEYDMKSTKMIV